jgi:hypothetical protein
MKKETIFVEPQSRTKQQKAAERTPFEQYEDEATKYDSRDTEDIDFELLED